MGTHFPFLFSIYSENHGVQAEPLNFARSSDITYVPYIGNCMYRRRFCLLDASHFEAHVHKQVGILLVANLGESTVSVLFGLHISQAAPLHEDVKYY